MLAFGVHSRLEELPGPDAGQFEGVLEGQKHAFSGAFLRLHCQQVLTLIDHFAGGNLVVRLAGEDVGQRALSRAVGSHDCVDFAGTDLEVDAVQDVCVGHLDVETADLEHWLVVVHGRIRLWFRISVVASSRRLNTSGLSLAIDLIIKASFPVNSLLGRK